MARTSVVYEHAVEVLADGRWHPYEWALYEVAKRVPPNLAMRRAERDRVHQWRKEHPGVPKNAVPPRARGESTDYLIKVGSRSAARDVLKNERFEQVRHKLTKQRLVRLFDPMSPPPPNYEHFLKRQSKYINLTSEEIKERYKERIRKGQRTALINKGIDPDSYVSKREQAERKRAWWNGLTEEERRQHRSDRVKRAWDTKRKAEQEGQ